jgi:hypothetical protein
MKLPSLPTNLSRRERLLAIGSALVIAVVGMDRLVLGPWLRHMQQTRGEIHRLEAMIRTDRELLRRKPQILGQAEVYREYLQTEGKTDMDMASMLREIETLGSRSGIALGAVKPLQNEAAAEGEESAPVAQALPSLAIEVDYKGSMDEWVHFLYLLETSRSLFDIERATVSRMEEGSSQVEGSLRVTTKAATSAGAAAVPTPSEGAS